MGNPTGTSARLDPGSTSLMANVPERALSVLSERVKGDSYDHSHASICGGSRYRIDHHVEAGLYDRPEHVRRSHHLRTASAPRAALAGFNLGTSSHGGCASYGQEALGPASHDPAGDGTLGSCGWPAAGLRPLCVSRNGPHLPGPPSRTGERPRDRDS